MKTLYGKFMVAFLGLVILIFAFMFIGMEFFIETYYYKQKVETMQKTVVQIKNSMAVSDTTLEFIEDLSTLAIILKAK